MSATTRAGAALLAALVTIGCDGANEGAVHDWNDIDYTAVPQDNDSAYTQPQRTGFCGLMHDFRCE